MARSIYLRRSVSRSKNVINERNIDSYSPIPWIPEPSTVNNKLTRRFNLLFTVEGSGIQGNSPTYLFSNFIISEIKKYCGEKILI